MAGIRQLAKHLELSIGTVSRALNDKPDVNPATRQRVLEAARELGYVPNQSGRSLRSGATNTIGFVMETGTFGILGGDDFFLPLADRIQAIVSEAGFDLVILPCHRADDPASFLTRVVSRHMVDAVIISATRRHDPRIEFLAKSGLPFLSLGRSLSGPGTSWIDLDVDGVARRSVEELVALGHRRIAAALPERDANLRYLYHDGYREALEAAGLDYRADYVARGGSADGAQIARTLLALDAPPTGIVLSNERMAFGIYEHLREVGKVPGRDISVIGFRRNRLLQLMEPGLDSFELSVPGLGRAVAEAILAELRGGPMAAPTELVWPLHYTRLGSSGPPPPDA